VQYLGSFSLSLSFSFEIIGPQTISAQMKNALNYQRHMSMSVSDNQYLKGDEMMN
jgi:hypothetical protein